MASALTGARIFDGDNFLDGMAVVMDAARIVDVAAATKLPKGISQQHLGGGLLAPGFLDVQVNGGGGALLNDAPSVATLRQIAQSHRTFGTTGMLPTIITDRPEILQAAILAVRAARIQNISGVLGIHIEGPFIDPARKGAHDARYIRPMSAADVELIAGADCGVVLLTLAPNWVAPDLVRQLVARGVLVSLGHSDATFAQAHNALEAGAQAFTHLFNAMSQIGPREPGMVGAALMDAKSYCGLIADGHHVHDGNLKLALATKPKDRIMLISDAMSAAAGGPDVFTLQGRQVRREAGRLALADGTLAGSNLTMDAAVRYCVGNLGLALGDVLRMASRNPANFIQRGHELGCIKAGYLASMVHLTEALAVKATWVDGISAMP